MERDNLESALQHKLSLIDSFTSKSQLPSELSFKIKKALERTSSKMAFKSEYYSEVFEELPLKIRCEVAMVMYKGALKAINFFQHKDPTFVTAFVPLLKLLSFTNKVLFKEGDPPNQVFFIV